MLSPYMSRQYPGPKFWESTAEVKKRAQGSCASAKDDNKMGKGDGGEGD